MTRNNEHDVHRGLKESRYHSRRKLPEQDRRGWLEAILIGLIVAVFIAAASFAGQWLDSVVVGWVR